MTSASPRAADRSSHRRFGGQEQAYAATMAALCQAVDTKDLCTRGHSERVSRGAVMTGREIGFLHERPLLVIRVGQLVSRAAATDDRHCSTARSAVAADVWLRRTGGDPGV